MKLPSGISTSPATNVCQLNRSLYDLKQAPRTWFEKFQTTILGFSFIQNQYDSSLFLQKTPNEIVILLVYMNDIIVTSSYITTISEIWKLLNTTFHVKDLGQLTYFLELAVHHQPQGIVLNQNKYIEDWV